MYTIFAQAKFNFFGEFQKKNLANWYLDAEEPFVFIHNKQSKLHLKKSCCDTSAIYGQKQELSYQMGFNYCTFKWSFWPI